MASDADHDERLDLVVIGSGIAGLCAAKTYTHINTGTSYAILEAESGLGGVWALERIYPNLQTNNLYGFFEYSDFPAALADLKVQRDTHIPGKTVNQYLSAYARHFNLEQRIRFRHRVQSAEYQGAEGWVLTVRSHTEDGSSTTRRIFANKLIVAAGLCSRPQMPNFAHIGENDFKGAIFHGKEMASRPQSFTNSKSVVVFGGTKMSWDAAYAYAQAGVKVHWVIRESGHGPCWMAPAYVTPFKLRVENLVMTRLLTWFSPCIWAKNPFFMEQWARGTLQQTALGRKLVKGLFGAIQGDVCHANRYDRCPETAKLKPWTDFMWVAGGQGVLGYERDVFGMVEKGMIEVHIDEIKKLSDLTVHLKNDGAISADAIVCCTGWHYEPAVKFLPEGIEKDLGIPYHDPERTTPETQAADEAVTSALPILKNQPPPPPRSNACVNPEDKRPNQPYRLYRFMAPQAPYTHDRNIAFIGMQINFGVPLTVQAQSLWINAYFNNQLPSLATPPQLADDSSVDTIDIEKGTASDASRKALEKRIRSETMLHTQFCKWRFPWGFGARFPDFTFELMPYLDLLLTDLGLEPNRKMSESVEQGRGSWMSKLTFGWSSWVSGVWRESFEPYEKTDYVGLADEWLAKQGQPEKVAADSA